VGSILYVGWIVLFLHRRRKLEMQNFVNTTTSETALIQLLTGIQEIKLYNLEQFKRWNWERIQARIFKVSVSKLSVDQYQSTGANFIYHASNIMITFFAARAVINGEMTLGMLLAIQYILGQLEAPVKSIIGFVSAAQESKIILERIHEVYARRDEEVNTRSKIATLADAVNTISIRNLSFSYDESASSRIYALENVSMEIKRGQKVAFVGTSGSGKTTMVNLLLKFHEPTHGEIKVDGTDLGNISNSYWRSKCSAVLQGGVIFADTVSNNIAVGEDNADRERVFNAARIANIHDFVAKLPQGFETRIGPNGIGLSQGQKQRIMIARAIYRNSDFIFFDEATNALDANNERVIMENLERTLADKTVIIVAHRLSTVKNADQIFVFDQGKIVESGNHIQLTERKAKYYELVKNQLELGN
jgi:ATP-binding cassette subfamily B protein